jgi:predicted transcriptional regulator of viral defense system
MSVRRYLETTPVFTITEFKEQFPTVTSYNLLVRAEKAGRITRVRRGLYVSNTGRYIDTQQNRYRIAAKLAEDTVFAYQSALALLGVAHNVTFLVQYYSKEKIKTFSFQGNSYKQYTIPTNSEIDVQTLNSASYGDIVVTTKEQTLIDCLSYVGRAGGAEALLRSLSGFPYMDIKKVVAQSVNCSQSTIARIGWVLEQKQDQWRVNDRDLETLRNLLTSNSNKFVSLYRDTDASWSKRWNLILPTSEEKMKEWIE